MTLHLKEAWQRARAFLREGLWSWEPGPGRLAARGLATLQFTAMVGEGFVRDRLMLRASALTYFTVLGMIPLLAVAVSIMGALGVTENLAEVMVEQLAAGSPEAQQRILDLVKGANFGGLGTLGAVFLFVTTVLGISNIERALNSIWGVQRERSWARRFPDYLAVLVVAPLLLGTALSLSTTLRTQWLVQRLFEFPLFSLLYDIGLRYAPVVVLAGGLGFLYWFLPNTQVRVLSSALGGLIASVLVGLAQSAYIGFSIGVARYNALFGGFAALPLLFVWIFVFWAIVLFGAEIAFAHQNLALYRREVRGRRAGPAEREAIGLRIACEVARSFRDGDPRWTAEALSETLSIPVRTVRDVLERLHQAAIVALEGRDEGEATYLLGRPAEKIFVGDVLEALRGPRELARGSGMGEVVETLLAELEEGALKGPAGRTLADAIAGVGPVAPESSSESR